MGSCPDGYVWAAAASSLVRDRQHVRVDIPGGPVLLTRAGGKLHCVGDTCPHAQARLSRGDIEDIPPVGSCGGSRGVVSASQGGPCVQCPRHRKKFGGGLYFDLESGIAFTGGPASSRFDQNWRIPVHEVLQIGEGVYVSGRPKQVPRVAAVLPVASSPEAPNELTFEKGGRQVGWFSAELQTRERVNRNTFIFTFACRHSWHKEIGAKPVAALWHLTLRTCGVERDYTPLSSWEVLHVAGEVALLIKLYPDGAMSKLLHEMRPGTLVELSTPVATCEWNPVEHGPRDMPPSSIGLIVGGTGVMPAWQAVQAALEITPIAKLNKTSASGLDRHPAKGPARRWARLAVPAAVSSTSNVKRWRHSAKATASSIFPDSAMPGSFSHTPRLTIHLLHSSGPLPEDMLLHQRFADIAAAASHADVQVCYMPTLTGGRHISSDVGQWVGRRGRIDIDALRLHLPAPETAAPIIVCGPEAMLKAVGESLHSLGHSVGAVNLLDA